MEKHEIILAYACLMFVFLVWVWWNLHGKEFVMLVLSRKKNQKVMIGDEMSVTVIEIRDNKVRLGIDAPRGVEVHREEIWLQVQQEAEA